MKSERSSDNQINVLFSSEARADLVRLREFIHIHNPDAAERAAHTILEAINTLKTFPKLGKPVRAREEYRDLAFVFGRRGYVMRYRLTSSTIRILRVWHVREDKK